MQKEFEVLKAEFRLFGVKIKGSCGQEKPRKQHRGGKDQRKSKTQP